MRGAQSEERRKELGEAFIQLEVAPIRPHPRTPQTPEVRAAAGPLAGLFDNSPIDTCVGRRMALASGWLTASGGEVGGQSRGAI